MLEWPEVPVVDANDVAWVKLRELRTRVTEAIEPLRRDKIIGSSLEAEVTISDLEAILGDFRDAEFLAEIFITSTVDLSSEETAVTMAEDEDAIVRAIRDWLEVFRSG